MKLNRIMIAAPKSGSGKTVITCALLAALKDLGEHVYSYKCGPDYIDPMFHRYVLDVPSKNLDTFFTDERKTRELFYKERKEEDFAVLEGVMGLFDGLGGTCEEGSSYHLAKVTQTPIILVVDAKGMGRSLIPLIAGFLAYDREHLIRGVLLNRMSKSYYAILKPLIEAELGIHAVGFLPEQKEVQLESRHLGLKMPHEIAGLKKEVKTLSELLQETADIEIIRQIARDAAILETCERELLQNKIGECSEQVVQESPLIAVARDEAFCFYYEDNLELLREYGAKLIFFSPLRDTRLPEGCVGLILGGGYPELYADRLSQNVQMRETIRKAVLGGMPALAECGGFMYLHRELRDKGGNIYPMAGVVEGICYDTGKLVRFGYIELQERMANFLPEGGKLRGHEFHYFDSTANGADWIARKPVTGKNYACIEEKENYCLGFPHLYYPSNPLFVKQFVEKCRKYKKIR